MELLLQSGLRIEEACELTTLDILKRRQPDGRVYYLLHVKPSKFDRARVIPIGDGLGRVIAEMIAHVKAFYASDQVPACDHWDCREKRPYPRAPYLLQGIGHPSPIAMSAIRNRLARLSDRAGATCADGSPLRLRPHDCRRLFASEHLNNNTPLHIIQWNWRDVGQWRGGRPAGDVAGSVREVGDREMLSRPPSWKADARLELGAAELDGDRREQRGGRGSDVSPPERDEHTPWGPDRSCASLATLRTVAVGV